MEKEEGRRGIFSTPYLNQVLEAVIFPYYDTLTDARKGKARLPRLNKGIRGFDWPPSYPDLNPIEWSSAG